MPCYSRHERPKACVFIERNSFAISSLMPFFMIKGQPARYAIYNPSHHNCDSNAYEPIVDVINMTFLQIKHFIHTDALSDALFSRFETIYGAIYTVPMPAPTTKLIQCLLDNQPVSYWIRVASASAIMP